MDKQINSRSCQHLSDTYDGLKTELDNTKTKLQNLQRDYKNTAHQLQIEKIARNEESQYHKCSSHLKIHSIPWQDGEEAYVMEGNTKVKSTSANNVKSMEFIGRVCNAYKLCFMC